MIKSYIFMFGKIMLIARIINECEGEIINGIIISFRSGRPLLKEKSGVS